MILSDCPIEWSEAMRDDELEIVSNSQKRFAII